MQTVSLSLFSLFLTLSWLSLSLPLSLHIHNPLLLSLLSCVSVCFVCVLSKLHLSIKFLILLQTINLSNCTQLNCLQFWNETRQVGNLLPGLHAPCFCYWSFLVREQDLFAKGFKDCVCHVVCFWSFVVIDKLIELFWVYNFTNFSKIKKNFDFNINSIWFNIWIIWRR